MSAKIKKIIALYLILLFLFQQSGFAQIAGQLDISGHLAGLRNAFTPDVFRPLHLRFLSYDTFNNNFRLLLDKGSLKNPKGQEIERATKELLNYFFVGITLPNDAFWVNLRPDAEDNIIDGQLAQTDVGKILLESDLQLKKDTAKFTSPQTPEGKEYWDKLYQKAGEIFGSQNITIPTLTRPWIVPDEIIIRETTDSAYIYKATLKVMLEQDYLKDSAVYNFEDERLRELNEYSSQLLREIIIPKLTKEVNSSKRYSSLRQVYYSLIMAQWFKARFANKDGLYSRIIDRKVIYPALYSKESWSKTTYFKEYQKSFKDGEYNIQEPVYTLYGQTIRSYFSGGEVFNLGRIPPMGEMARNPETGATISSIPTTSSPVINPKLVIGVKVNTTDNPGEVKQVQIEGRVMDTSALENQGISQEISHEVTAVNNSGKFNVHMLSNPFFLYRIVIWLPFHISRIGLKLSRSLKLEMLSFYFAEWLHAVNVPKEGKEIATLETAIQSIQEKRQINIVYYPGIGFDVKTALLSTDAQVIVGVDPLDDAHYIEDIYVSEILALGGKKLEVFREGELDKGGKLVFRFNYNGRDRQVIFYREDATKYTPDVIKETNNGYDMFLQIGLPIPPRDFIEKSVNSLNEGGLFLPFADRIDTGENIGNLRLPLKQKKAAPIIRGAGSIWIKDTYTSHSQPTVSPSDPKSINVPTSSSSAPIDSIDSPSRLPLTSEGAKAPGGIDFRNLPIVIQAIGNLSANIGGSSIKRLSSINLDSEWREISNLVNLSIIPSAERIKEYVQASCQQGNADKNVDKVISCISDILRIEEERYSSTDPILKDILVVLDSANSVQQLKTIFIGTTP